MARWQHTRFLAVLLTAGTVGLCGLALALTVFASMDEVTGVRLPQLFWLAGALALTGGLTGWGAARLWEQSDREQP